MPAYRKTRTFNLFLLYTTKNIEDVSIQNKIADVLDVPLSTVSHALKNLPCRINEEYCYIGRLKNIQAELQALGLACGFDDSSSEFLLDKKPTTVEEKEEIMMQMVGIIVSLCNDKHEAARCVGKVIATIGENDDYKRDVLRDVRNEFFKCTQADFKKLKDLYR